MTNSLALVIEDDPKLATIFSLALQAVEFEAEIVSDGHAALARLAEVIPSVVVLDLHLPGLTGREILRHIRADERLAKTQVMLATADALMAEHLRSEADLVLLKPIQIDQLQQLAIRLQSVSESAVN